MALTPFSSASQPTSGARTAPGRPTTCSSRGCSCRNSPRRTQIGPRRGPTQRRSSGPRRSTTPRANGWSDAAALFERGRTLAAAAEDREGLAFCLNGLAQVKLRTARARAAIEDAGESVRIFRRLGMRRLEGSGLKIIGDARAQLGELEQAREAYEQALAAVDDAGLPHGKVATLLSRGRLWQLEGNVKNARRDLEEALSLSRKHRLQPNEAAAHEALGELSLRRSEPLRAREAYEEAAPIYHALGDRAGEARAIEGLGDACASMNDLARARDAYQAALGIERELGSPRREAALLVKSAGVRHRGGDREGASRDYQEAVRLYEQMGDRASWARTLMELGELKAVARDWPEVIACFELAATGYRAADGRGGLGDSLHRLGMALYLAERTEEARQVLLEAFDVARAAGDTKLAAEVKGLLEHLDKDAATRPGAARG
jgi:tetratricopeptide (TPR) repeat protein